MDGVIVGKSCKTEINPKHADKKKVIPHMLKEADAIKTTKLKLQPQYTQRETQKWLQTV